MKAQPSGAGRAEPIRLRESLPLLFMHLGCVAVLWVPFNRFAVLALAISYVLRVFALTGGFHRYFAHKSYQTSRGFQFVLAFLGTTAAQLGPLWWASHHRRHHRYADTPEDIHSPARRGFLWAHIGWLLCPAYAHTDWEYIKDFSRYPELRFLDRHPYLPPLLFAALLYAAGAGLRAWRPEWAVSGAQWVVWGFFVGTVAVYHVTFCINSLLHLLGRRRYPTADTSRNNWVLAILTMGEGWHNNHHRFAVSARQGFYWWEVDLTYYILRLLAAVGLVWDLRSPPESLLAKEAS